MESQFIMRRAHTPLIKRQYEVISDMISIHNNRCNSCPSECPLPPVRKLCGHGAQECVRALQVRALCNLHQILVTRCSAKAGAGKGYVVVVCFVCGSSPSKLLGLCLFPTQEIHAENIYL